MRFESSLKSPPPYCCPYDLILVLFAHQTSIIENSGRFGLKIPVRLMSSHKGLWGIVFNSGLSFVRAYLISLT